MRYAVEVEDTTIDFMKAGFTVEMAYIDGKIDFIYYTEDYDSVEEAIASQKDNK